MDETPPMTDGTLPGDPGTVAVETAHDRHLREMEASFETLEQTVAQRVTRVVKIAVPVFIGLILAAVGSYLLGGYLRDRAEAKRIAKQMKIVRAERILGRRRRRRAPALVEGPLTANEAGEIITGVLAELAPPA